MKTNLGKVHMSSHLLTHSLEFDRGAQYERKAVLSKLRRELKNIAHLCKPFEVEVLRDLEQWLIERGKQHETKSGGLGR